MVGTAMGSPPWCEIPVRTSTRGPFWILRSTMRSKLSNSTRPDARSGRYQPRGGAGQRLRRRPSKAPLRSRMRSMVRTLGGVMPLTRSSRRMASRPYSPKALDDRSSRRTRKITCSTPRGVRFGGTEAHPGDPPTRLGPGGARLPGGPRRPRWSATPRSGARPLGLPDPGERRSPSPCGPRFRLPFSHRRASRCGL